MNFLASFLLLISVSNAEDLSHLRVAKWYSMTPNIVLCNGAQVDQAALDAAMTEWRNRGEKIGKLIRRSCDQKPNKGEIGIYVTDDMPVDESYGIAYRSYHFEHESKYKNDIWCARILIDSQYTDSKILLEHELGHAFGFRDTDDRDSIMSSKGSIY